MNPRAPSKRRLWTLPGGKKERKSPPVPTLRRGVNPCQRSIDTFMRNTQHDAKAYLWRGDQFGKSKETPKGGARQKIEGNAQGHFQNRSSVG